MEHFNQNNAGIELLLLRLLFMEIKTSLTSLQQLLSDESCGESAGWYLLVVGEQVEFEVIFLLLMVQS